MSTALVTPETLTLAHIAKWDGIEMRKQMAHPEMRTAILEVLKNRSLADVEAAAVQPIVAPAEEQVTAEAAAEAEAARLAQIEIDRVQAETEEARKVAEEAARPKKFVLDYQIKDEDGNPIGRPTHLEAASQEEMQQKMIEAHTQATRAFHRLKKQKVSFKPQDQAPVQQPLSDQELLVAIQDVRSGDSQKALEAQAKITNEERRKLAVEEEALRQKQVSIQFLRKHAGDFNNCEANVKLIADYIQENELAWTLDNLEIAFAAKELELAPVVKPVAPVAPVNPAPATPAPTAPAVTTPTAALIVQPTPTVTVPPTPPANPAPAQPRPGVNGGLIPGQQSGSRPEPKPTGLTVEEIRSWDGPTMRKKMQNPAIRPLIEKFVKDRNAAKQK